MCTILNTETVLIEAQLPESDLGRLGSSHGATYETTAQPGTLSPSSARAAGAWSSLGPPSMPKPAPCLWCTKSPMLAGHLRIGMALTVSKPQRAEALAVPASALVEEDGRVVAFVQVSGETFQKRDLTLGIQDGDFIQVLSGLAPGERVVTKGAYAIRLASVSTTIPAHGHAH